MRTNTTGKFINNITMIYSTEYNATLKTFRLTLKKSEIKFIIYKDEKDFLCNNVQKRASMDMTLFTCFA